MRIRKDRKELRVYRKVFVLLYSQPKWCYFSNYLQHNVGIHFLYTSCLVYNSSPLNNYNSQTAELSYYVDIPHNNLNPSVKTCLLPLDL